MVFLEPNSIMAVFFYGPPGEVKDMGFTFKVFGC